MTLSKCCFLWSVCHLTAPKAAVFVIEKSIAEPIEKGDRNFFKILLDKPLGKVYYCISEVVQ